MGMGTLMRRCIRLYVRSAVGLARPEGRDRLARHRTRDCALQSICPGDTSFRHPQDVAHEISSSELGFIAEQRGDPALARSWHLKSLTAAQTLGDPQAAARALTGLAGAQALGGQPDQAAQLLGAADTAWRSAGTSPPPSHSADINRITAATRRALGEAAFAAEFQHGRRLRPEQASSLLRHSRRQHRARQQDATCANGGQINGIGAGLQTMRREP